MISLAVPPPGKPRSFKLWLGKWNYIYLDLVKQQVQFPAARGALASLYDDGCFQRGGGRYKPRRIRCDRAGKAVRLRLPWQDCNQR